MRITHSPLFVITDVGGGNTDDSEEIFALSHVSLRWMVQEIVNSDCGISFLDDEQLRPLLLGWNIPPEEARPPKTPPPKVSEAYNGSDAVAKIIDELQFKFEVEAFFSWIFFWFLEALPTYYEWQRRGQNGKWVWCWQFRQVNSPLFHILAVGHADRKSRWCSTNCRAQLELGLGTSAASRGRLSRKRQVLHELDRSALYTESATLGLFLRMPRVVLETTLHVETSTKVY